MRNLIFCLVCLLVSTGLYASTQGSDLRVMSYNVRNGIGMDGKQDFQRVAEVIAKVNPDVMAVQELDSMTRRSKNTYVLEQIARSVKMNYVYGPAIKYDGGKYGIGLLSKEKPLHVKTVALPGREEARALLVVEFESYVFLATHLSLTEADQLASVELILKEAAQAGKPVLMAGDMNSIPSSPVQTALRKDFEVFTDGTWKTCNGECIDFIYGYKDGKTKFSVLQRRLVEDHMASDHCPVWIDIRFR